jgi:hypothetical protein
MAEDGLSLANPKLGRDRQQIVGRQMLYLLFRFFTFGYIRESYHNARCPALFIDRCARILDGEAGTILPPENLS